ncbi:hypothetical protein FOZ63_023874, partial [Perkinsus olseni]
VGGYIGDPELSSASEIHWHLPTGETATWTYEGENDGFGGTAADVDPSLILTEGRSKRHKPAVDYAALEAQLRREEAGLTSESSSPTERRQSTDFTYVVGVPPRDRVVTFHSSCSLNSFSR